MCSSDIGEKIRCCYIGIGVGVSEKSSKAENIREMIPSPRDRSDHFNTTCQIFSYKMCVCGVCVCACVWCACVRDVSFLRK